MQKFQFYVQQMYETACIWPRSKIQRLRQNVSVD